jgi:excisionase family DNA binding protein
MGQQVQPSLLLTREQAAERLSLSVVSVDRLRRQQELKTVKLGRAVRIPVESVSAFLLRKGVQS